MISPCDNRIPVVVANETYWAKWLVHERTLAFEGGDIEVIPTRVAFLGFEREVDFVEFDGGGRMLVRFTERQMCSGTPVRE
jgi:hypothetical protein